MGIKGGEFLLSWKNLPEEKVCRRKGRSFNPFQVSAFSVPRQQHEGSLKIASVPKRYQVAGYFMFQFWKYPTVSQGRRMILFLLHHQCPKRKRRGKSRAEKTLRQSCGWVPRNKSRRCNKGEKANPSRNFISTVASAQNNSKTDTTLTDFSIKDGKSFCQA